MDSAHEEWQAEVNGEVYETTFAELTVWISENSLIESDKVRRGNLRWLEAGRVPPLRPFFDAKANGTEPPKVQMTVSQPEASVEPLPEVAAQNISPDVSAEADPADFEQPVQEASAADEIDASICAVHNDVPAAYVCKSCAHGFCKGCPDSFGANVRICPYCGGMCGRASEMQAEGQTEFRIQKDIAEGFGFGDFGAALAYPFKYKFSLFAGALIVAVLGYGQSAGGVGSFFLIGAAIVCFILSSAIVFGMISNTLNNFAKGDIESNFMPTMDDFSAWDDVVHPFFLFVGVWLSSFGLATFLTIGVVWYTFSTITSQMNSPEAGIVELTKESAQSANHVQQVRQKLQAQNEGLGVTDVGEDGLTDAQRATINEEAEFQRVNDIANNYRKGQLESTIGKTPETQQAEMQALAQNFIKVAGVLFLLIGIAVLWGLFYFPAACAVAGYTRSFAAAINPLVGLDTIRHMGFDYVKILLMCLLLSILSGIVGGVFALVFSPFDMPGVGNLPAKFAASFVGFYFWVVFAVTLGFALYKNSDKLKLYR